MIVQNGLKCFSNLLNDIKGPRGDIFVAVELPNKLSMAGSSLKLLADKDSANCGKEFVSKNFTAVELDVNQ